MSEHKGGKPPKSVENLSKTMNFRVRPTLYEKLKASADVEHRSLSEEIERRLNRSFERDELDERLARIESKLLDL